MLIYDFLKILRREQRIWFGSTHSSLRPASQPLFSDSSRSSLLEKSRQKVGLGPICSRLLGTRRQAIVQAQDSHNQEQSQSCVARDIRLSDIVERRA